MLSAQKVSDGVGHPKQILTSFGFVLLRTGGSPLLPLLSLVSVRSGGGGYICERAGVRGRNNRGEGGAKSKGRSGVLYIRAFGDLVGEAGEKLGGAESRRGRESGKESGRRFGDGVRVESGEWRAVCGCVDLGCVDLFAGVCYNWGIT